MASSNEQHPIFTASDIRSRCTPLPVFTGAISIAWTLRATVLYAINDALMSPWKNLYSHGVKTIQAAHIILYHTMCALIEVHFFRTCGKWRAAPPAPTRDTPS